MREMANLVKVRELNRTQIDSKHSCHSLESIMHLINWLPAFESIFPILLMALA